MPSGKKIRSKAYASCLRILKELATCTLQFRGIKEKNK